MRDKLKVSAFLLLFSTTIFAQVPNSKVYLGITIGPAIPFFDLAKKDFPISKSGFQGAGPALDLCYAHRIGKHLGWAAMLQTNLFLPDTAELRMKMIAKHPDYNVIRMDDDGSVVGNMYFVGPYYTTQLNKKGTICLDAKAMAGFGWYLFMNLSISARNENTGDVVYYSRNFAFPYALAGLVSASLRFNTNKSVGFLFNVDFSMANIKFNNFKSSSGYYNWGGRGPSNHYSTEETFTMTSGCLRVTAGLVFRLRKEDSKELTLEN